MFYSPSKNAFFAPEFRGDYENSGTWPADAVEIDREHYDQVVTNRPADKDVAADADDLPILVDR